MININLQTPGVALLVAMNACAATNGELPVSAIVSDRVEQVRRFRLEFLEWSSQQAILTTMANHYVDEDKDLELRQHFILELSQPASCSGILSATQKVSTVRPLWPFVPGASAQ